jgi:hypothetical protein
MSLCAANGVLLQPSFPLTAVDAQLAGHLPGVGRGTKSDPTVWTQNAFATYTTVGSGNRAVTGFVVAAFIWQQSPGVPHAPPSNAATWMLRPSDLSVLLDCEDYPPVQFHEIPNGAYKDEPQQAQQECTLNTLAASIHRGSVIWTKGAESASLFSWDIALDSGSEMELSDTPTLAYISPVSGCGIALLGEEGKVAMLSTYRFADIESEAEGLRVSLRGDSGEHIVLLYVRMSVGFVVQRTVAVAIGANGTASFTIPA